MFLSPWCPHAAGSQNILLSTLSAWQDALNLLQNTKGLGIQSDAITFNSIMAYHGRLSESLVACVVGKITSWTLSASTSIPWFEFTTIMRMCFFRRGKTTADQKFQKTTAVVPSIPLIYTNLVPLHSHQHTVDGCEMVRQLYQFKSFLNHLIP